MGKEGRWGENRGGGDGRGESEVLSTDKDMRRNLRVILLCCITLTEEAPQPPTRGGLLTVPGNTYPRLSPGMKGTPVSPDALEHLQTHTAPAPDWVLQLLILLLLVK